MKYTRAEIYAKVVQAILTNTGENIENLPGESDIDKIGNLALIVTNELEKFAKSCSEDFFTVALAFLLGLMANKNANKLMKLHKPKVLKATIKDTFNRTTELMTKLEKQ